MYGMLRQVGNIPKLDTEHCRTGRKYINIDGIDLPKQTVLANKWKK